MGRFSHPGSKAVGSGDVSFARAVGEDGFALLDRLARPEAPQGLGRLPKIEVLRRVWERHFVRGPTEPPAGGGSVRLRGKDDPPPSAEPVESPYDCAACLARPLCTRAKHQARHLSLQPRAEYEALKASRARLGTKAGRRRYARRAAINLDRLAAWFRAAPRATTRTSRFAIAA